jgi:PAS domain S-box-containing protein
MRALGLKPTITIFTVALFISTIWALAHDLEKEVRNDAQEVLARQQFQTVEFIAASLDEAVRLRTGALTDAASLIKPEWMTRPDRLHAFMAESKPVQRFFNTGIYVISIDGVGLADLPQLDGREGASFAERDFFREVVATGKPFIGKPVLGRFTKKPVINIAVAIRNERNEIIGVLAGVNTVAGSDFLGEILPSKSNLRGDIHIISPKNHIFVASSDPTLIMQADSAMGVNTMYDRYRQGYEGSGIASNSQGLETLTSAKRSPTTGWIVMATLPTDIAFKSVVSLQREIYKDAALASAFIALLLFLFLHRQLSPLSDSAEIIDAMASENEPLQALPLVGSNEIRRLLDSFNKLQERIKNQQQSLREHSEQIRLAASVFEGTSEAILITSRDNCIISVNRAFCNLTGYDEAELIGRNPKLLQSGRHDNAFYEEMWSSLLHTGQWSGEIWNRRKNGEIFPERITISTLYDEAGNVLHYIAIAADITNQKQAEAVIWRHEEERRHLIEQQKLDLERNVVERTQQLQAEQRRTKELLHNILPEELADELAATGTTRPIRHEAVTILFTDFSEFTQAASTMPPDRMVAELNDIFAAFDDICDACGVEKIKTIGDAYMAAAGVPTACADHAQRCVRAGLRMADFVAQRNRQAAFKWAVRIGIHTGPVVAGVVGKRKYAFDIWGDTVNIASRMESAGEVGKVNISAYTYDLIRNDFACEYRGKVSAKGKGEVDMYFVIGPKNT